MPIAMTPDQYFEGFVEGNYDDYIDNPGCVRRAFNAAISATHMADHWFRYYERHDPSKLSQFKSRDDFLRYLSKNTNGYFNDIRSIAIAYKHLYVGDDQNSSIRSTGDIEEVSLTGSNIQKVHEEAYKVVYTRKSGKQLDFLQALWAVFQYWKQEFS